MDKGSYRTHISHKPALYSLPLRSLCAPECVMIVSAFISHLLHSYCSTIALLWRSYRTLTLWVRISWYEHVSSVKRTRIALVVVMHSLKSAFILHLCYKRHMSELRTCTLFFKAFTIAHMALITWVQYERIF